MGILGCSGDYSFYSGTQYFQHKYCIPPSLHIKPFLSLQMQCAENTREQCISQVTPKLGFLTVEFASCHPSYA